MTKNIILIITFLIVSPVLLAQSKAGKVDSSKHATFYSCAEHSDVISDKPGKCFKCSMDLELSGKARMKAAITKTYNCPVHLDVIKHDPGKCPQCGRKLNLSPKEQMKAEVMKLYTCPMHPEVALDKDGKCPKCGARLVQGKQNE